MSMQETWPSYVRRVTQGLDRKTIAAAAGMNVSGVGRWLHAVSRPSAEKVISFARGLHHSPIEALVAAGYLDEDDIGGAVKVVQSLAALSDDAVIEELRDRLRRRRVADSSRPLNEGLPEWSNEPQPPATEHPDVGGGIGAAGRF